MPRGDIADLTATANLTCRNAQRNAFLFIGIPKWRSCPQGGDRLCASLR